MRSAILALSIVVLSAPLVHAEFVVKARIQGMITTPQNSIREPALGVAVEMDGDPSSREMFVAFGNNERVGIAHVESAQTDLVQTPGDLFLAGAPHYQVAYYDFDGDGLLDVLVPVTLATNAEIHAEGF